MRRVCKAGNGGPRGCSLMKNRCSLWLWPRASRDAFLGRGQTRKEYGDREGEGGWYPRAIKILRLCKFHVVETQRKINRGSSSAFSLSLFPSIHRTSQCVYIYNTARFRILPSTCSVYTWKRKKYRRNKSRNKSVQDFSFFFFRLLCDQVLLRVMGLFSFHVVT